MKIKESIELSCGSDGFWYDLTMGGYFKPEQVMADEVELEEMKKAIELVCSLEEVYNDHTGEF